MRDGIRRPLGYKVERGSNSGGSQMAHGGLASFLLPAQFFHSVRCGQIPFPDTPRLPGNLGLGVEGDGSDYHSSLYNPSKETVSL